LLNFTAASASTAAAAGIEKANTAAAAASTGLTFIHLLL
jgi:hypothetical protein